MLECLCYNVDDFCWKTHKLPVIKILIFQYKSLAYSAENKSIHKDEESKYLQGPSAYYK